MWRSQDTKSQLCFSYHTGRHRVDEKTARGRDVGGEERSQPHTRQALETGRRDPPPAGHDSGSSLSSLRSGWEQMIC